MMHHRHLKQYVLNLIVDDIIDGNMGSDQLEEEERVRLIEPLVDLFSRVDTGNTGEILREDLMVGCIPPAYVLWSCWLPGSHR